MKVFKTILFIMICLFFIGLILNFVKDKIPTEDKEPVTEITLDPTEIVF